MRGCQPRLRGPARHAVSGAPAPAPRWAGPARRHFLAGAADPGALSALDAAADDFPDLAGFTQQVHEALFEPGFGHVSTLAEWDDYEWSWTGSLVDWALHDAATDAAREHALAAAREHRQQWLGGYRSVLGFATVVLHDLAAQQDAE